jgi:20S proteasome subunit alpha 2
LVAF